MAQLFRIPSPMLYLSIYITVSLTITLSIYLFSSIFFTALFWALQLHCLTSFNSQTYRVISFQHPISLHTDPALLIPRRGFALPGVKIVLVRVTWAEQVLQLPLHDCHIITDFPSYLGTFHTGFAGFLNLSQVLNKTSASVLGCLTQKHSSPFNDYSSLLTTEGLIHWVLYYAVGSFCWYRWGFSEITPS